MKRELNKDNKALYNFFITLDRSEFMDDEYREYADYDSAFPIGFEQTISQPTMVYGMTSMLELKKEHKVLEIGTGSGYQTAFLAQFGGKVFTVERIPELSESARKRLKELGFDNIQYKVGDGSLGWEENAPYDRIIATAAAGKIPEPLVKQLKPEGRMVIPVGEQGHQELYLITKDSKGNVKIDPKGEVAFVEFVGEYGWKS